MRREAELPGDHSKWKKPCTFIEYFYGALAAGPATYSLPVAVSGRMAEIRFIRDSLPNPRVIAIEYGNPIRIHFPFLGHDMVYELNLDSKIIEGPLESGLERSSGGLTCQPKTSTSIEEYGNVWLLSSVLYPYGYTMRFGYDEQYSPPSSCWGVMTSRVLPTGARSEYEHSVYSYGMDTQRSLALMKRRLLIQGQPPAEWTYTRDPLQVTLINFQPGSGCCRASLDLPDQSGISTGFVDKRFDFEAWKKGQLAYSNPPRVYETDPDGNLTIYYVIHDKMVPQGVMPLTEYYGLTWAVEKLRGSNINGTVESLEGYRHSFDSQYDLPYDQYGIQNSRRLRPVNLTRTRTKRYLLADDGSYTWTLSKQSDPDGYGMYQVTTEYDLNSTTGSYRTTRTNSALAPSNTDSFGATSMSKADFIQNLQDRWILNIASSSEVRIGASGPVVKRSHIMDFNPWGQAKSSYAYGDPDFSTTDGVATSNTYDTYGRLVRTDVTGYQSGVQIGATRTTTFDLDDAGRVKWKQFGNLAWKAFERTVDADSGLTLSTTTPAGGVTTYTYDDLGRLTSIVPGTGEMPTSITYPTLQLTTVQQGATPNRLYTNYRYDEAGRLIQQERINRDGLFDVRKTSYDLAGRKVFQSEWEPIAMTDPLPGTQFEYWVPLLGLAAPMPAGADPLGYVQDPLGRLTRVIKADGGTTEYVYDALKKTVKVLDLNRAPGDPQAPGSLPVESTTVYTSDQFGRLTHVQSPSGGEDASYTYDRLDNLLQVVMGGQIRTFAYDGLGHLLKTTQPENGLVSFDAYDGTGLLLRKTDASGVETKFTYDDAGRIKTETRGGTGQLIREYFYDTPLGGASDRAQGRLVAVQNYEEQALVDPNQPLPSNVPLVRREMVYEGLNGRLSQETTYFGDETSPQVYSTTYAYNNLGLLWLVRYPMTGTHPARQVVHLYVNGFLTKLWDDQTVFGTFVDHISYNPAGGVELIKYPNSTETETIPDVMNRPTDIVVRAPDVPAVTGKLEGRDEGTLRMAQAGSTTDWLDRWVSSVQKDASQPEPRFPEPLPRDLLAQIVPLPGGGPGGGSAAPPQVEQWNSGTYVYDGAGNIISTGTDTFQYDALSRLTRASLHGLPTSISTAVTTYRYDGYGNMTQRTRSTNGTPALTWDFAVGLNNQIQSLVFTCGDILCDSSSTFQYDPRGNLVSDGKNTHLFDAQGRLQEVRLQSDGKMLGSYDYDDRGYRVRQETDGMETFYIRDLQGRVLTEFRRASGSSAQPVWDQDYIYAAGRAVALVKNQAPEAPRHLKSRLDQNQAVELSWSKNTADDLSGYLVYRQEVGGPSGPSLLPSGLAPTVFQSAASDPVIYLDASAVPGLSYEYFVMAQDTAGNLSSDSRHLVVDISGTPVSYVTWATLAVQAMDGMLYLDWGSTAGSNHTLGYRICRSPSTVDADFVEVTPELIHETHFTDVGLTNGTPFYYKVILQNTSEGDTAQSCADAALVVESGTPVDNIAPSPPTGVRGQPTITGDVILQWSASYASDLKGYRIYENGTQIRDLPFAPQKVYRFNFTDATTGETQVGYTNVSKEWFSSTSGYGWNGLPGGLSVNLSTHDADLAQAEERLQSWVRVTSSGSEIFSVVTGNGKFLVELTVGCPVEIQGALHNQVTYPTVSLEGTWFWNHELVPAGTWSTKTKLITVSDGTLDMTLNSLGSGCVNSMVISDTGLKRNLVTIVTPHTPYSYSVSAYDDSGNEGMSETITASLWGSGAVPQVTPYEALDGSNFYIREWGQERHQPTGVVRPYFYSESQQNPDYSQPIHYRATGMIIAPYLYTDPNGQYLTQSEMQGYDYLGMRIYRSGCWDLANGIVDDIVLLTPDPVEDGAIDGTIRYQDTSVTDLCYTYYIAEVGGDAATGTVQVEYAPKQIQATYAYPPREVMGQYAYGANLVVDPESEYPYLTLAIPEGGGWELGSALPGNPVVVTWQPHPNPAVVGYRIWVSDGSRQTVGASGHFLWNHLADVEGRLVHTYLDYNAPCNWPLELETYSGESPPVKWNHESCIVYDLLGCGEEPQNPPKSSGALGYFAEYFVEGLTDMNEPIVSPLDPEPGKREPWHWAVRAVGLCDGACTIPGSTCTGTAVFSNGIVNDFLADLSLNVPVNLASTDITCGACFGLCPQIYCRDQICTYCQTHSCSDPDGFCNGFPSALLEQENATSPDIKPVLFSPPQQVAHIEISHPNNQPEWQQVPWRRQRHGEAISAQLGTLEIVRSKGVVLAAGTIHKKNVTRLSPDRRVGQVTAGVKVQWLHSDHLGSTRLITNEQGAVVSRHKYLPFGEEYSSTLSAEPNTHKFTGHERDQSTGLDYMYARYYSPESIFRFLSVDPTTASIDLHSPQSFNKYSYALNNPIRFLDLDGKETKKLSSDDVQAVVSKALEGAEDGQDALEVASKALESLGDFEVSGADLVKGLEGAGVDVPDKQKELVANVESIKKEGDTVTIQSTKKVVVAAPFAGGSLRVKKTASFTIKASSKKLEINGVKGIGGRFLKLPVAKLKGASLEKKDGVVDGTATISFFGVKKTIHLDFSAPSEE